MTAGLEVVDIALAVGQALERMGVDYALGGSVATSLQGEPRSTNDIDFAVRLEEADVPSFVAQLGPDFDVDEEALVDAIRRQRSANIFHLPSMTKVDLFIRGGEAFDVSEFSRRVRIVVQAPQALFVASVEDNLLRKLRWFRMGAEASDRQWRDVLGLLRASAGALDVPYLRQWAPVLGIDDLLERVLASTLEG
jgi:energy-coupling factor transporter ATP-binding protein EcfA2